jgi:O-antigen/teichoic acid export membrane protein
MQKQPTTKRVRLVLRVGSLIFGLSAVALVFAPDLFNGLLGLTTTAALEWAMRMIGITLVALAGNMFSVASRGGDEAVLFSGKVMLVSAFGLGVLTLMLPVALTWFAVVYAMVGFGFSAAYAGVLYSIRSKK